VLEQIKVLNAILALDRFTPSELSTFAGVKLATVYTILNRRKALLEDVAVESTGRPGGQVIRQRLKHDAINKVRKDIAEVASIVAAEQQFSKIESIPDSLNLESAEEILSHHIRKASTAGEKRQLSLRERW
jgi:hypothetical protein